MKRLNESFLAKNMQSVLCCVTSEAEKRIFTDELGYKSTQVVITGYPRFDALQDTSAGHREILMMPTHRSWLFGVEREVFVNSDYYRRYMDLLNSPRLIALLEEHDLTLMFYVHPSIGEHRDAFASVSKRVQVVPYDSYALDDLMMRCKLLVTDYSSIAWDVYYMGKPTVFYQYDTQAYLDTWGSYIDLSKECPGERAETHGELLGLIESYVDNGFALKEEFSALREKRYAFLDADNARRVCDVLKKRRL